MRLLWTETGREDLFQVAELLNETEAGSGDKLLIAVLAATDRLAEHPRIGASIGDALIRKWTVADTDFLLLYQIRGEQILLLRLIHNRSDWHSLI